MNGNLAYQEEFREELLNGEFVAMSPRPTFNHNRVAFNIAVLFENRLKNSTCTAIVDGVDLYLTEKDRFVPDMMVVCDRDKIRNDGVHGAPDLVVEVLSPRTANRDRGYKMELYAKSGVREYWLVSRRRIRGGIPAGGGAVCPGGRLHLPALDEGGPDRGGTGGGGHPLPVQPVR